MRTSHMFVVSLLIVLATGFATPFSAGGGAVGTFIDSTKQLIGSHGTGTEADDPDVYAGGMLGVSARVVLCRKRGGAHITLSGVPVGGTVSGMAHFVADGDDRVVLGEPLAGTLRRRFVKILAASHNEAADTVVVVARLPFLLGTQTIVLVRDRAHKSKQTEVDKKGCWERSVEK